jgi:hypothetical protein
MFNPIFPEDKVKNEIGVVAPQELNQNDQPKHRFFHEINKINFWTQTSSLPEIILAILKKS